MFEDILAPSTQKKKKIEIKNLKHYLICNHCKSDKTRVNVREGSYLTVYSCKCLGCKNSWTVTLNKRVLKVMGIDIEVEDISDIVRLSRS